MNESQFSEVPQPLTERVPISAGKSSPGAQLAAQRQAFGWSLEQAAEQLKLAPRQLAALEADDYAALPGMATVRGFIRAYAKILKLDPAPLLATLATEAAPPMDIAALKREMKMPQADIPLMHKPGSRWMPAVVLTLTLLVALLVMQNLGWINWLPAKNETPSLTGATASATPAVSVPAASSEVVSPAAKDVPVVVASAGAALGGNVVPKLDPNSKPAASLPAAVTPVQAAAKPVAANPAAAPISTAEPAPAAKNAAENAEKNVAKNDLLVLKITQDSWVEVRRPGGSALLSRILRAGSEQAVEIKEPVLLVVGNVSGVEATLRGVPLELKAGAANTARVNLK